MILGRATQYLQTYSPDILYPVPRSLQRENLRVIAPGGFDLWRGWELSWLDPKGKPAIRLPSFIFPSKRRILWNQNHSNFI